MIRILLFSVLSSSALIVSAIAVAQQNEPAIEIADDRPWDRLPDGRVVIDINGVRFALPVQGSALSDFVFVEPYSNAPPVRHISLRRAIEQPAFARKAFSANDTIFFRVVDIPGRPDKLLGHFDRESYSGIVMTFSVWTRIQMGCRRGDQRFDPLREKIAASGSPGTGDDWIKFKDPRTPTETWYLRSVESLDLPKYFDSFICGTVGNACTSSSCPDASRRFNYSFSERKYPQNTWHVVARRAFDMMNYVWGDDLAKPDR